MCNNFDSELKHDRQTDIQTDRMPMAMQYVMHHKVTMEISQV